MLHQTSPTPAAAPGTFEAAAAAYDAAYEAVRAENPGRRPKRRAVLALALGPGAWALPDQTQIVMQALDSATVYTAAQLHTRNRRRQYQTTDGRFQLRRAGESDAWYWHPVEKQDGRTRVGDALTGPAECFRCQFGQKAEALATLNTLCAHYGF